MPPSSALFDLTGKVALVTGGSRGIGRAIAEELARAGARVVLSSNEPDECERAAAEMRRAGLNVTSFRCDVVSRREIDDLVAATLELHARIDVLVCNAGVVPHAGPIAASRQAMLSSPAIWLWNGARPTSESMQYRPVSCARSSRGRCSRMRL